MNTNLLAIVKQIIAEYGEGILADPRRLKAFFSDLAKDEPKPLRIAFGRCIEAGAYNALKTALDTADRTERKVAIAQRLRDEYGLDITLCGEALDILEVALLADIKVAPHCTSCGKELQEEWKVCPFCGTAIGAKQAETPTALPISHITPTSPIEKKQMSDSASNSIAGVLLIVIVIIIAVLYWPY
jgi:hypothetical protein